MGKSEVNGYSGKPTLLDQAVECWPPLLLRSLETVRLQRGVLLTTHVVL